MLVLPAATQLHHAREIQKQPAQWLILEIAVQ
jgi:hypothetical protein